MPQQYITFAIQLSVFVITIGTLLWRLSARFTSINSEVARLEVIVVGIQKTDERQDNSINRIDNKTTHIDKQLAVVATQTDTIMATTESILQKLDRMSEKLNK